MHFYISFQEIFFQFTSFVLSSLELFSLLEVRWSLNHGCTITDTEFRNSQDIYILEGLSWSHLGEESTKFITEERKKKQQKQASTIERREERRKKKKFYNWRKCARGMKTIEWKESARCTKLFFLLLHSIPYLSSTRFYRVHTRALAHLSGGGVSLDFSLVVASLGLCCVVLFWDFSAFHRSKSALSPPNSPKIYVCWGSCLLAHSLLNLLTRSASRQSTLAWNLQKKAASLAHT